MAQRDIDKTPADLRNEFITGLKRRMENLAEASEGTGARLSEIAGGVLKEEVFGIPGLPADMIESVLEMGCGGVSRRVRRRGPCSEGRRSAFRRVL